jgi:hypothetical protein
MAGAPALPLTSIDSAGVATGTGGYTVVVDDDRAMALIDAAFETFRARGFYLFVADRADDGGSATQLALLPTADPYAVMRAMHTSGGSGIGTDSMVSWFRALEHDQPLVLTEIGYNFVSGRVVAPLGDPRALAARFASLCPDVLAENSVSVDALARQILRSRTVSCWWD